MTNELPPNSPQETDEFLRKLAQFRASVEVEDYEEAWIVLEGLLRMSPYSSQLLVWRGMLVANLEESTAPEQTCESALETLQLAHRIDPRNIDAALWSWLIGNGQL